MNLIERVGVELTHLPILESNVSNWRDAKIVVFLINHNKEYKSFIDKIIGSYEDLEDSLLLYETPSEKNKWTLLESTCWEDPDLIEKINNIALIFQQLKKQLQLIPNLQVPQAQKEKIIIALHEEALKWGGESKDKNLLLDRLKVSSIKDLEILKGELVKWINQIFIKFKNKIVKDTFPLRQSTLIKKTKDSLHRKRVFVICGSCHGNCDTSNFKDEAKKLIDFLKDSGSFTLFDCGLKEKVSMN